MRAALVIGFLLGLPIGFAQADEPVLAFERLDGEIVAAPPLADAAAYFPRGLKEPALSMRFARRDRSFLLGLTTENIGRPIGVIICGELISQPVVREPIRQGSVQVNAGLSVEETVALAEKLKNNSCDE
ncbi:MAG: hypothetical protein AAFR13_08505 [Pseudomonadota bacterium]